RRRHTRFSRDWSSDVCSSDLAAARANRECGELSPDLADAIISAAEEVIQGKWDDHFVVDVYQAGAGTSQNMNANEVIAGRAAELLGGKPGDMSLVHPNDHVNRGQSTNDPIHVAINIAAAEGLVHECIPAASARAGALWKKAEEFHEVLKSGRTHLQDAVPMRLGQEFEGYAASLDEAVEDLKKVLPDLYRIGLGGNAVGTGINTHPDYARIAIEDIARRTR